MQRIPSIPLKYRTLAGSLVVGTALTLLMLLVIGPLSFFTRVELAAYDWQFTLRGRAPLPHDVVVVGLDTASFNTLSKGEQFVPRRQIAHAVDYLHSSGARAVALDFLYLSRSSYGSADDAALAGALKRAGNVVLDQAISGAASSVYFGSYSEMQVPIRALRTAAVGVGLANVPVDSDGEVRYVLPVQYDTGRHGYPSMPVVVAAVSEHRSVQSLVKQLPGALYVNFPAAQNPGDARQFAFLTYPLDSVAKGEVPPSAFRGKTVLVIPAEIDTNDVHRTALGNMFGGVIEASTVETILQHNWITPAADWQNGAILLILGLITTLAAASFGIWLSAGIVLILAIGYGVTPSLLFQHERIWINLVTPEATVVLVFGAIMALRFATEERQRRRTGKIFGQYVKPEIVDILVNSRNAEKTLTGARRPITVTFTDIRGFTAMSESMTPEQVVEVCDLYLEELTESVQMFDGTLDKYVGDEIMAIWNAPRFQDDHALLAVRCALDMVNRMERINEALRQRGLPAITYGTGISTGDAVVGEMGSSFRKQYDVIGDTVNTAARLCGVAGGGEVLISEGTWRAVGDRVVVEPSEPVVLKGKNAPVPVFKVVSLRTRVLASPGASPSSPSPLARTVSPG